MGWVGTCALTDAFLRQHWQAFVDRPEDATFPRKHRGFSEGARDTLGKTLLLSLPRTDHLSVHM